MSEELPGTAGPTSAEAPRDGALVAAVAVACVEAVALAAYALGVGIATVQNPGSGSAGFVVVVIFLLFAAGIAACARGLWLRRRAARTPFAVVQVFGLVTGWTLTQGDGDVARWSGWAVLALSVVGIALALSPGVGRSLEE